MADLFAFVLVLVAVAYSTWIVLPWAFYDKLETKKANRQIGWLRQAEVSLFVSATFLVFYVIADLASGLASLDITILALLPIMKFTLLTFGLILLLGGLFNSFRVVNFCAGAKETEHRLTYWAMLPFLTFEILVITSTLIAFGIRLNASKGATLTGWVFVASLVLALIGTGLALKWINYLADLERKTNVKGLVSLILAILPIILLVVLYLLGHLGVSFFF